MDVPLDPLSERLPIYAKAWGLGALACVVVGVIYWTLSSSNLWDSVGYTFIFVGTFSLLIGGARGGGYTNLGIGAVEAFTGGRNRIGDDFEEDADLRHGEVLKRRDPMERLRKGLRPPANPEAFWTVLAGIAYLAIGVVIVMTAAA